MLTAVAGVVGTLVIGAWAFVAWAAERRQPWLLAPLALLIVLLVVLGLPGWSFVPIVLLAAGAFAVLVIGAREAPVIRARDPEAPLSTERWAAAVAAPFRVAVAEPWDAVVRPQLRRRYRRILLDEWGVEDRAGLLATVDRLWSELHGGPSADLVIDLRTGAAHTRGGAAEQPERRVLLSPDQVARMREVTGAAEAAETVVVRSYEWWRSAHLVRLACAGATLDWLSQVESQRMLRRVASDLQRRFSGWQRLSEAFHGGYLLWRGGAEEESPDRVWTALGLLHASPESPWNLLPWDMPLERAAGALERDPAEAAGAADAAAAPRGRERWRGPLRGAVRSRRP
ncbi:DUF1266 domain-containing protein [Nocardiopsis coralliicola]